MTNTHYRLPLSPLVDAAVVARFNTAVQRSMVEHPNEPCPSFVLDKEAHQAWWDRYPEYHRWVRRANDAQDSIMVRLDAAELYDHTAGDWEKP